MFVGREVELSKLNKRYDGSRFEFAVIYGRRRVGKTTLIQQFCREKKAIYYIGREVNDGLNLANFSREVFRELNPGSSAEVVFDSWESAFDYIAEASIKERIILVIDEYPYVAAANRSVSSILQAHIDTKLKDSKLFLVLCGSSMSFMENQVLGYQSPLYGRRTVQFKIKPFTYYESSQMLQTYSYEEQIQLHIITGGVPEYLSRIETDLTMVENIVNLFLDQAGHLYEEPANLLKQELREPATYNSIIEAIAGGASRLSVIAGKTNMPSNTCNKYIRSLVDLGIVKKEKPITEKHGKKTIYLLEDQMFRFWYRFIPKNMSSIASGLGLTVYKRFIEPNLSAFMGLSFEGVCSEYLLKRNSEVKLPLLIGDIGRWWGNNHVEKRQEEIDIIATDGTDALFGECKWRNEPVGIGVVEDLKRKSQLLKMYTNRYYILFSKSGFSKELIRIADAEGILLVDLESLFRR